MTYSISDAFRIRRARRRMDKIPHNIYHVRSPATATVVSNERITDAGCDDVRHIALDRSGLDFHYLEGQALGVLTPGDDGHGHANKLRLFSIASGRDGDDGAGRTVSICVKRVVYRDPATGEVKHGVASNYLCDLNPGDAVSITGPVGKRLLLPSDPKSNLILVATGTGIAPFRAFLARIFRDDAPWQGQVFLFFGCKTCGECLYQREFEGYRRFPNFRFVTALSREQQTAAGERMHVDHRMAERIAEIWSLLDHDSTYLYVCGIKGTEAGVFGILESRARAEGVSWQAMHGVLLESGRLLVETY